jgi:hypothetical protein
MHPIVSSSSVGDTIGGLVTIAVFCAVMFFVLRALFRWIRNSWKPLEIAPDLDRFAPPFAKHRLYSFTGRAGGVTKNVASYTSGGVSTDYEGNTTGSISTSIVTKDQFFLTAENGSVHPVSLQDWDVPIGEGHVVSVAWTIREGRNTGPYFLVFNHTTNLYYTMDSVVRSVQGSVKNGCLTMIVVFFTLPFSLIPLIGWPRQLREFKANGIEPLLAHMRSAASSIAATT